jgi:enoyl-CoA hydratase/carnithine racemase
MGEVHLLYHVEDRMACLTINREPQRNALSPEAIRLFHQYLDRIETDDEIRVVLITGAGPKAFCTGADLGGALAADGAGVPEGFRDYARLLQRIHGLAKPTVAKVRGYCLAGGLGLMLSCDLALAEENSRFGTPEVNVGLFPMMIGALIFRNVLHKKAMEMILTGRMLTAAEAESMGLITRRVAPKALDAEIEALVRSLASKSPIGLKIGKQAFAAMAEMPFGPAVDFLAERFFTVMRTDDAREGLTAFLEKRAPVFTGK